MEDLKKAVALLFKRKGKDVLTEKEFVFSASMDMRWFSPKDAQRLLDLSREAGLVTLEGGNLVPAFDLKEVKTPMDFVPSTSLLQAEVDDVFQKLVQTICGAAGLSKKEVVSTINGLQGRMGVYGEVAALIAALHYDVDVTSYYDEVEALIKGRKTSSAA